MLPVVSKIEIYLPKTILTTEELSEQFNRDFQLTLKNTGIRKRHIRKLNQIGSDLGFEAAKRLLDKFPKYYSKIDFVIFCTEGLDYKAPTTSSTLHHRLGLKEECGCIDMPMGCAGYIYGLSLADSILKSENATCVLFIAADIPTSVIHSADFDMRVLFGDAGTATIIEKQDAGGFGKFVFGNDGSGVKNLFVERGSTRSPIDVDYIQEHAEEPQNLAHGRMYMNGLEITRFSLSKVPELLSKILEKNNILFDEIDLFVFHQASLIILNALRRKCKIPESKFYVFLEEVGNTVSCSIPIALYHAELEGKLIRGNRVMLLGFGVGYSWGGTILEY